MVVHKGLIGLAILSGLCIVVELLPVISVPITPVSNGIYLANYRNYTFGVFGICDVGSGVCSLPKIGYPSVNNSFYNLVSAPEPGVRLPSSVTYTISKLLVVHVISFGFSCLLFIIVLIIVILQHYEDFDNVPLKERVHEPNKRQSIDSSQSKMKKRDLTPYINLMLTITLLSFISTLLGFLADILLFVPNLSYLGWIQLFPIIVLSIIAAMLCFLKRAISSRKYLENHHRYENDDMRMRRNVVDNRWNDDASDDGFFVYANEFNQDQNQETMNLNTGFENHDEDVSLNSERIQRDIELDVLRR